MCLTPPLNPLGVDINDWESSLTRRMPRSCRTSARTRLFVVMSRNQRGATPTITERVAIDCGVSMLVALTVANDSLFGDNPMMMAVISADSTAGDGGVGVNKRSFTERSQP
jgi:hypothetical protein